ncbi:MAG: methyltransferase [Cytophagales bacterium CG12_big_fil_rev_8_21_14_0_65_40_12]|nr:MAG: methyltransferase [Cytophagales bacterium CG12_big_fil_rev_8_21_14_0_65_40_12]PIW05008.1 MAG: methyltransferase [Cytophagales bacterium CG17_big_fil_post_rev_8_21_14_2_50_40_13]
MSELKIIVTEDGSHSLYNADLNETYHSFHGAVQESKHVFIKEGLDYLKSEQSLKQINVLEVGFGTGLNALLALEWANENQVEVNFTTLEPFPLKAELYEQLNYAQFISGENVHAKFLELHRASWEVLERQGKCFSIFKTIQRLQDFNTENKFNIIFFDAFAPSKQSEMWGLPVLSTAVGNLVDGGVLVTYCAQGQLKRDLKYLDMEVQTLPGPPGKKEMVRAIKLKEAE